MDPTSQVLIVFLALSVSVTVILYWCLRIALSKNLNLNNRTYFILRHSYRGGLGLTIIGSVALSIKYFVTLEVTNGYVFLAASVLSIIILWSSIKASHCNSSKSSKTIAGKVLDTIKVIQSLVILVIAGLLAVPILNEYSDNWSNAKHIAYLEQNKIAINTAKESFGFPPEFYQHHIFLLAEDHGYADSQDLDLSLLKHLNRRAGLRYYLAEIDPAEACAFNLYIQGGTDTLSREVFDLFYEQKLQWANKEFFDKLTKLRQYNASLPIYEQITMIGLDKIRNSQFAYKVLQHCKTEKEKAILQLALAADKIGKVDRYASIEKNIHNAIPIYNLANEKLYGMWGTFHGMQSETNGITPLAQRLSEKFEIFNSVVTIRALFSSNSVSMMPSYALPKLFSGETDRAYTNVPANIDHAYIYYLRGINDLKQVAGQEKLTIFKIDAQHTPYATGNRLLELQGITSLLQPIKTKGAAADAFQYVALFQASLPLTPWRGKAHSIP